MTNKIYNKFIPFLVFIQPIFDVITSFMTRSNYTITIGIVLKMIFLVLATIYLLFIDKNKKKNIIYLILIAVVIACNLLYNINTISSVLVKYFNYTFKYVYYTIMLLYFIRWVNNGNKIELEKFRIPIALICVSYILSIITKSSILSYDIYRIGISGWYYSANEFGTLLTVLFPVSMYNAFYSKNYKILDYILFLMCAGMLLGLGTKTGMLGYFLPIIVYIIYRLIMVKNEKLDYKFLLVGILLVGSLIFFNKMPAVQNIMKKIAFEKKKIANVIKDNTSNNNSSNNNSNNDNSNNNKTVKEPNKTETQKEIVTNTILSGRDKFEEKVKTASKDDNKVLNVLFGRIHLKESTILIVERDFKDIYNLFGVMALLIVAIPIMWICIRLLLLVLSDFKLLQNKKLVFLSISVLLALGIAYICGHTLLAPSSTTFLCLIMALLVEEMNTSQNKKGLKQVMFISSVGGHLTQLLELKNIFEEYSYVLVTEKTDVTKNMKDKYTMEFLPYGSRHQKLIYPFILLYNCLKSLIYIIKYNPEVIITTGANTAAAMCCLGKLFGKKVIYIESFAKRETPTITGKCIYKLHAYTVFVVQWESMLKNYPKAVCWGGIY